MFSFLLLLWLLLALSLLFPHNFINFFQFKKLFSKFTHWARVPAQCIYIRWCRPTKLMYNVSIYACECVSVVKYTVLFVRTIIQFCNNIIFLLYICCCYCYFLYFCYKNLFITAKYGCIFYLLLYEWLSCVWFLFFILFFVNNLCISHRKITCFFFCYLFFCLFVLFICRKHIKNMLFLLCVCFCCSCSCCCFSVSVSIQ